MAGWFVSCVTLLDTGRDGYLRSFLWGDLGVWSCCCWVVDDVVWVDDEA